MHLLLLYAVEDRFIYLPNKSSLLIEYCLQTVLQYKRALLVKLNG